MIIYDSVNIVNTHKYLQTTFRYLRISLLVYVYVYVYLCVHIVSLTIESRLIRLFYLHLSVFVVRENRECDPEDRPKRQNFRAEITYN